VGIFSLKSRDVDFGGTIAMVMIQSSCYGESCFLGLEEFSVRCLQARLPEKQAFTVNNNQLRRHTK